MTGLVVTLRGTVAAERPSEWDLFVCGLPVHVGKDREFAATRSFLTAGTYVVSASLRRPFGWRGVHGTTVREEHITDCQVSVSTTPEETEHVRSLCAETLRAGGEVDEDKLLELMRTYDLRAVPTLWSVIESHPHRESQARIDAVQQIGNLAHLDSVPRLLRLLTDRGVYDIVCWELIRLGLWGPFDTDQRPHPNAEQEVRTMIESLSLTFAEQEPALRLALHQ